MQKPLRRTDKHIQWMINLLIDCARRMEIPVQDVTRDQFVAATPDITRTDVDSCKGWGLLKDRASIKAEKKVPRNALGLLKDRASIKAEKKVPRNALVGLVSELPVAAVPKGYYVKNVSSQMNSKGEVQKQWLQAPLVHAKGDLTDQIPEGHSIKGVSTLVSGDGTTRIQWVKTERDYESPEQILERIIRDLPTTVPVRQGKVATPTSAASNDLLAVYPMGDPHIGLLSWAPETGESFDLIKAKKITCDAMRDLVLRGPRTKEALIVNLGDFFHSDSQDNKTARSGNPLDVDGRWQKVLQVGLEIMVFMIDQALAHHDKVSVVNEIGNHDDHSAVFLSVALNAYYTKEPRVHIDMSPSRFHWFRFGKNFIGITHGHNQKQESLESIMASERPEDWGATLHRFWYCGHIHHSVKKEMRGCVVEHFRTLAARDAWAANVGHKSGRDMNRITLHREFGETGRDTVNAAYLQARYREES